MQAQGGGEGATHLLDGAPSPPIQYCTTEKMNSISLNGQHSIISTWCDFFSSTRFGRPALPTIGTPLGIRVSAV